MTQNLLKKATRIDRKVSWLSRPVELFVLKVASSIKPVIRIPFIGVVVSEGNLMRSILMDTTRFSKTAPGGTSDLWDPILRGPGLLNMSGQDHLDLKRKLTPLFNARLLEEMVGSVIATSAKEFADNLVAGHAIDVVAYVERMSALVICTLSGYEVDKISEKELLEQLDKARGLLRFVKLTRREFTKDEVQIALQELSSIHNHIAAAYDRDDEATIPHLLKQHGFTKAEAISIITALIIAGTETVISHLPRFTQLLVTGRVLESSKVPDFDELVHEGLRVTVPTPVMLRGVVQTTQIGSVRVKPGDRILLATTFACRRAGDFNPERPMPKELRNLWFGAGVHLCIGMPLAQLEILTFTSELYRAAQLGTITIRDSRIRKGSLTAGYSRLVLQWQHF